MRTRLSLLQIPRQQLGLRADRYSDVSAGLTNFRGRGISEKTVWHVVKETAASMKIPQLSPHDLRRSCARLCHASGGELEQIQFLLGHVSVQTTERYIGCKQRFRVAVNDKLGIEPGVSPRQRLDA